MQVFARVEFADKSFCFLNAESYSSIPSALLSDVVDVTLVSEQTTPDDLAEARRRAAANRAYLSVDAPRVSACGR